ncbi:FkbM family methyltransferase [Prosthecobacter fusiformis]|uniref:FkbM family methyltransferase n=1 Tax=Prosthecobacter fusiformis TaxID=48464 RepID=A0A4R7RM19_9BACT|nr:FkbM family methyltransferase [Prosthecobacter fusiformis]TDU64632.1 FkbM family methyltransferase [Prosthecobacter fusiformis]
MSIFDQWQKIRGHSIWTAPLNANSVVVDAGAHKGEFSQTMNKLFGCRCILIEANPDLAKDLVAPSKGEIVHAALAATDGVSQFVFRENQESGSICTRSIDRLNPTASVQTISLKTLRLQHGINQLDLLKLDIEGAEFELIEATPDDVLSDIGQITVEFHDFLSDYQNKGLYEKARSRLERLGFTCINMAFRTHGDVIFLNQRRWAVSFAKIKLMQFTAKWVLKVKWGFLDQ